MVWYDWIVEETDEWGDVVHTVGYPSAEEAIVAYEPGLGLALMRGEGEPVFAHDQAYAYFEFNGSSFELPAHFDNGVKVPKSKINELRKAQCELRSQHQTPAN